MTHTFDAIIVGAGQAGPFLASRLAESGRKVALVERKLIGGTCVNNGCTPTKAMVASARAAYMARRGAEFGFETGPVSVDMKRVRARAQEIVLRSRKGLEDWLREIPSLTLFRGTASFQGARTISVGDELLQAPEIFLNVGARPIIPNLPGIESTAYLTSTTILDLEEIPRHLVIVGGGYVGLEFAQMFRRFGSEVTIIDRNDRLAAREDEDVSKVIDEIFSAEQIQIRTRANCIHFETQGAEIRAGVECDEGAPHVTGSHVLLAMGRQPNTDDLNLSKAGVMTDERGFIMVDDHLHTTAEGVYALGDCNGLGAFTHTSYNDFEIVADNLLTGSSRKVSDRIPVHALFVDPPQAQVGMTERELRESGRSVLVGMRPMTRVARAVEKGETFGFLKVFVDSESRQILGANIFGPGADEAIHCVLTAMYAGQPASLLTHSMHIHPTLAELIPTVMAELKGLR